MSMHSSTSRVISLRRMIVAQGVLDMSAATGTVKLLAMSSGAISLFVIGGTLAAG